ncbi:MAG TPA: hypothetical protein VGG19_20375 [Tepidisphaeraceae bacterium]|jgi:hypothetical protein
MSLYFASWAATFISLLLAIILTALIYRLMGDGLDLNGWLQDAVTALVVSAGQAGGYLLGQHFPIPRSYMYGIQTTGSVDATIFFICLGIGYKITHLTTWDPLEYVILGLLDAGLAFIALIALTLSS